MIKSLKIKNYQSHRNTKLEFCSGINGIIGKSLNGKTAILRALGWLINNQPKGFAFHSHFASSKDTNVAITLEDGTKISRNKKYYKIRKPQATKPTSFKGRKIIPEEIKDKLNISELNFQNQLDPLFLIASPPGRIAETINTITKVEKIDQWIKSINKKRNRLRGEQDIIQADLGILNDKIADLNVLDKLEPKISKLKKIERKIRIKEEELYSLDGIYEGLKISYQSLEEVQKKLSLKEHIKKFEKIEKRITVLEDELDLIESIQQRQDYIKERAKERHSLEQEYIAVLKKNKLCPTCYGPLSSKALERVKNEISMPK